MKKIFALIAIAGLFAVSCDEKPQPTDEAKTFIVSPTGDMNLAADATSATISVEADINWTVECDNSAFVFNPASGNGNATINVSFPANDKTEVVTTEVRVVPEKQSGLKNAGIKTVTVNIIQAAAEKEEPQQPEQPEQPQQPEPFTSEKVLAEWEFTADNTAFFSANFTFEDAKDSDKKPTAESNAAGFLNDNHYCPSNLVEGGKIRFCNGSDKTSVNPDGRCKRGMGNANEPCWYGNWPGDIVYLTAPTENLAAGTKVHIVLPLRPNTRNTLKYWLLEIKDGDKFVPVGTVKSVTVGATEVKYNVELVYDPDGTKDTTTDADGNTVYPDNPLQYNTIVDEVYTLTAPTSEIEYHLTCVSTMMADGSREANDIGDSAGSKRENPVLRIPRKDTTNGGSRPAGVNVLIEIGK